MSKLAIVIPAFKSMYFDQALLSIANQTNKNFILYIGDDCSPGNLYSIIEKYENRIPIVYKHFDDNLGGKDLVAQWERCIDLVGDEEWIWLFSDDDIMDKTCVERFYHAINKHPDHDIFHFNVTKIDENGSIIKKSNTFPEVLSNEAFLLLRLRGDFPSFVVEYIFRKSYFIEKGRFQRFDLGWGSDDATWIKLSDRKGIRTIDEAKVYWRKSQYNISPNSNDKNILSRKFIAEINYAIWLFQQERDNNIRIDPIVLENEMKSWFFSKLKGRITIIPLREINRTFTKFNRTVFNKRSSVLKLIYLCLYRNYKHFTC